MYTANLRLTGQENQHTPGAFREYALYRPHYRPLNRLRAGQALAMFDMHRKLTPRGHQHAGRLQQARHRNPLQSRRHDHDAQRLVIAKKRTTLQCEGQAQFGIEIPFVELVENDQPHTGQTRVCLQTAGEHTFGDDLHACGCTDPAFQTHAIAHPLPRRLAQELCHTGRRCARGNASWLYQKNRLLCQPRLREQGQWHQGGFARPGRRLQHHVKARRQCLSQWWQYVGNG